MTDRRRSESGNVFFTLFGAVALVGVIGAATATLMRGPVGTMVTLNQKAKVDAQMEIAGKLSLLEAASQKLAGVDDSDCDGDGYIEPLPPVTTGCTTSPTGGGCLPAEVGSAKNDPWGTNYGYCGWDIGTIATGACRPGLLIGEDGQDKMVMAIISAGADRTFQTSCSDAPTYLTRVSGSDDIILDYTYAAALTASGGLWVLKSGAPGTATIDKSIEVSGTAKFQSGITGNTSFSGGAFNFAGATGFFLPDKNTSGACAPGRVGSLRTNDALGQVLQICDPLKVGNTVTDPPDGDGWVDVGGSGAANAVAGADGEIQYNNGGVFGAEAAFKWDDTADKLITAKLNATGDVDLDAKLNVDGDATMAAKLDVTGASTFGSTVDVTGDLSTDANLDVGGNADVNSNLTVGGNTDLTGTLDVTGVSTFTDDALIKSGSAGDPGLGFSAASTTGLFYASGGIGLSVGGTERAEVTSNGFSVLGNETVSGTAAITGNVAGAGFHLGTLASGNGLYSNGAGGLTLNTGALPRIEIDSAGDIGIALVGAPTTDLDIGGVIRLRQMGEIAGANCGTISGAITYSSGDVLLVCSNVTGNWETIGTSGGGGGGAASYWTKLVDGRIYYNANNVGIGTLDPLAKLHVNGDLLVTGGYTGTASMNAAGAGTRFVFDPESGAIRAGTVSGTQWNDGSVGNHSIAFGNNVAASGTYSMGLGLGTNGGIVSGASSFGIFMGDQTGVNLSAINTMGLFGGRMVIDPNEPATMLTTAGSLALGVAGDVGAFNFCDENGANCFTASDIANGVTGAPGNDREIIYNSGGLLGADPGLFFTSVGNVGIGSGGLAPNTLTVGGSVQVTGGAIGFGPTSSNVIFRGIKSTAVTTGNALYITNSNAGNADPYIIFANQNFAQEKMRVDMLSGNVMIGVGNAGARLEVQGTDAILFPRGNDATRPVSPQNGMMRYSSTGSDFEVYANDAWRKLVTSTGGAIAAAGANTQIQYNSNGILYASSGLVFTSVGNIGIGTASPSYMLDAYGTVRGTTLRVESTAATDNAYLYLVGKNSGFTNTATIFANYDGGLTYRPSNSALSSGFLHRFQDDLGNAVMQIGTATQRGYVGIGTTAPQAQFEVAGTDSILFPRGNTTNRPASPVNGMMRYNSTNDRFEAYQAGTWQDILTNASLAAAPDRGIQFNSGNSLGAVSTFTYTAGGRVGIGTATPAMVLDVAEAIRVGSSVYGCSAATAGGIRFNSASGLVDYCNGISWTNFGAGAISIDDLTDAATDYTTGHSMALGLSSGIVLTSGGQYNLFIGQDTGKVTTTADQNTFIGYQNGLVNTTGYRNSFIGSFSGTHNTTGYQNSFVGSGAGEMNDTGYSNTAMGWLALQNNVGGYANTAIGDSAMLNATGIQNVGVGAFAMYSGGGPSTGSFNTALGVHALGSAIFGDNNVAVGYQSLYLTTGVGNIALGTYAGQNITSGSNNLILGNNISAPSATANNQLNIGNLIYSQGIDGSLGTLSTGYIGIGTTTPLAKLEVAGTDAILFPRGNTTNRPAAPVNGMMRYNSTNDRFEAYQAGTWQDILTNASLAAAPDRGVQFNSGGSLGAVSTFTYSSVGYVGIGTASPISPLHVFGGSTIDGTLTVRDATGTSPSYLTTLSVGASPTYNAQLRGSMAGGSDYFSIYGSGSGDNGIMNIQSGDNGAEPIAFNQYQSVGNLTYERMRIHTNGYVGIATANPVSVLDLRGSTDAVTFPQGLDATRPASPVNGMMRYSSTGNDFEVYANNAWRKLVTSAGGLTAAAGLDTQVQYNSNGSLAGASNLIYASNGYIGIGTASPNTLLTIRGGAANGINLDQDSSATSNSERLFFTGSINSFALMNNAGRFRIGYGATPGSVSGTAGFLMDSTGLISIGSTVPQAQLDVQGTDAILFPRGGTGNRPASPVNGMMRYNSVNDRFEAYQAGTWQDILTNASLAAAPDRGIQFNSGNALAAVSTFTYSSVGNVGIGIASPNAQLDVAGNTIISTTANNTFRKLTFKADNGSINTAIAEIGFERGFYTPGQNAAAIVFNRESGAVEGNLAFWTRSSGTYAERMRISQNGYVGIGTTQPGTAFEVAGTDAIYFPRGTDAQRPTTPYNGMMRYSSTGNDFEVYANNAWRKLVTSTGGLTAAAGSDTYIQYNSNGSLAGSAGLVYTSAGYVGIGTATPQAILDVANAPVRMGAVNHAGRINFLRGSDGNNTGLIGWATDATSADFVVQNLSGGGWIRFLTNSGEAMRITSSSGFVGIGTTSPLAQLQVGGTDAILFPIGQTSNRPASPVNGMMRYNSVNDRFEAYQAGTWQDILTNASLAAAPDRGIQFNSGNALAAVSTFTYTSAGNFGLGTASPQARLHVAGGNLDIQNNYGIRLRTVDDTVMAGRLYVDVSNALNLENSYQQLNIKTVGAWPVAFHTNNAEVARFSSIGYFGIGTTAPAAKLEVAGTDAIYFPRGTDAQRPAAPYNGMMRYSSTGNDFEVYANSAWRKLVTSTGGLTAAAGSDTQIQYNSNGSLAGSSGLVFTSAGNVGIGTTAPGNRLTVANTTPDTPIVADTNSTIAIYGNGSAFFKARDATADIEALLGVSTASGEGFVGTMTGHGFSLRTNNVKRMTIAAGTGNIGVGTLSPAAAFEVAGTDAILFPRGQTSNRPSSPVNGMMRYNSVNDRFEAYQAGTWQDILTNASLAASPDRGIQFNSGNALAASSNFVYTANGELLMGYGTSLTQDGTSQKFAISDTSSAASFAFNRYNTSAQTQPARLILSRSRGATAGDYTIVQNGDHVGRIAFTAADGTDLNTPVAAIVGLVDGVPGADDMPGALTFNTTADGGNTVTERMRIDSSGRVGIGDTNPSSALTVARSILAASGTAYGVNFAQTLTASANSDALTALRINPTFSDLAYTSVNHYGLTVGSGNVGFGTLAPTEALHVYGGTSSSTLTAKVEHDSGTSGQARLSLVSTGAGGRIYNITSGNSAYSNGYGLYFENTNGLLVTFVDTGAVGIGTSNPGAKLEVAGTNAILFPRGNDATRPSTPQNGMMRYSSTGNDFEVYANNAWRKLVTSTGGLTAAAGSDSYIQYNSNGYLAGSSGLVFSSMSRVGIATVSPETLLHIYGTGTSTTLGQLDTNLRLQSNTVTSAAGSEISFRGKTTQAFDVSTYAALSAPMTANGATGSTGYLAFSTKAAATDTTLSERMRITGTGRVGIGTVTPFTAMDINGTLKIAYGGEACDSSRLGAMYYSSVTGNFYACGMAGAWTQIATAGSSPAAGSTGYVQFNSGGSLGADSAFFWDNSTKRLGIGTNSPAYHLSMSGSSTGSIAMLTNNDDTSGLSGVATSESGVTTGILQWRGSTNSTFPSTLRVGSNIASGNTLITYGPGGSGIMLTSAGKFGFGTTTPVTYFDVQVPANSYANIYSPSASSNVKPLRIGTTGSAGAIAFARASDGSPQGSIGYVSSTDSGQLDIASNGGAGVLTLTTATTERMRVTNGGYVGIGTTSPTVALEVRGLTYDSSNMFNYTMATYDSSAAAQGVGGGIGFGGSADTSRIFAAIQGFHESATTTNYSGGLRFLTRLHGEAQFRERMRISSDGLVGIGTTTPVVPLDVADAIKVGSSQYGCITATKGAIRYNSTNNNFDYCGGSSPAWTSFAASITPAGSDQQVQLNDNGVLYASTGLNFNSSTGRMGINTTAPSTDLTVKQTGSSGSANGITIQAPSTGSVGRIYIDSGDNLRIRRSSTASDHLYLTSAGNVGIGTNPVSILDMRSSTDAVTFPQGLDASRPASPVNGMMRYSSTGSDFEVYAGGSWKKLVMGFSSTVTAAGSDTQVQYNSNGTLTGASGLIYSSVGYVGIGGAVPTRAVLEQSGVVGNTAAMFGSGSTGVSLIQNNPAVGFNAYYNSAWNAMSTGYGGYISFNPTAGSMSFGNSLASVATNAALSTTSRIMFDSVGNVGIGTTTPAALFTVGSNKFKVDSNGTLSVAGSTDAFGTAYINFGNATYAHSSASTTYGVLGEATNSGAGDIQGLNIRAISSYVGTVAAGTGVRGGVRTNNAGTTMTSGYAVYGASPTVSSGAIGTAYGLYIAQQKVAGVTTGYGLYQADAGDKNYFAGNVGIGTTTPALPLDVADAIRVGSSQYGCVTATKGAIRYNSTNNNFDYCGGSTPAWTAFNSGAAAAGSDRQMQFNSGGSLSAASTFVYTSAGYLGINNASPAQALDVSGNINTTTAFLIGNNSALSRTGNSLQINSTSAANSSIIMYTGGPVERMRIDYATGKIGMGTAAPVTALDVNGSLRMAYGGESCSAATLGAMYYSSATGNFYACGTAGSWTQISTGSSSVAAGSNSYVQFNSGGTLGADSNYVWDNTNKRLGIGTTSPGNSLDIMRSTYPALAISSTDNTTTSALYLATKRTDATKYFSEDATSNGWGVVAYANTHGTTSLRNSLLLQYWNGTTWSNYIAFDSLGRMGIGTTTPAMSLDVAEGIKIGSSQYGCITATKGAIRYNSTNNNFDYCGGSSPAWTAFSGSGSAAAGSDQQVQLNDNGVLYASSGLTFNSTSGTLGLYSGNYNTSGSTLRLMTAGVTRITIDSSNAQFVTNAIPNIDAARNLGSSSNRWLDLYLSRNAYVNGKVGIGTLSPATALDANGTIRMAYGGESCSASTLGAMYYSSATGNFYACGTAGSWTQISTGSSSVAAGSTTQVQFNSGGALAGAANLVYTSAGNVGIGTATTSRAVLEQAGVVGNTNAIFGSGSTGVSLIQNSPAVGFNAYYNSSWKTISDGFGGYISLDPTSGTMSFRAGTASAAANNTVSVTSGMNYTSGGDLGIGTAYPADKLHVRGTARIGDSGVNGILKLLSSSSVNWTFDPTSGLKVAHNAGANLDVAFYGSTSTVRMGVNTSSPVAQLEVAGTDAILFPRGTDAERPSTPANGMMRYSSTGNDFDVYANGAWRKLLMGTSSSATVTPGGSNTQIQYNSNGALAGNSLFVFNSSGNVGVGTSSPVVKLDVSDEIKIGSSTVGCNVATRGAMRYNSSTTDIDSCNGTAWVGLGSTGTAAAAGLDQQVQLNNNGVLYASTGLAFNSSTGNLTVTNGAVRVGAGNSGVPTFSFAGDTDTGMFNSGANALSLATGSSQRLYVDNTGVSAYVPFQMYTGSTVATIAAQGLGDASNYSQFNLRKTADNKAWSMSFNKATLDNGFMLQYFDGSATYTTAMMIDPGTFKVGFGTAAPVTKVDVNGSIRMGYGGESCSASTLGAMYYSSATGNFYACGTAGSWTQISTGSSSVAAGSNTYVQYNSGGVLGASANMTYSGGQLTVSNATSAGTAILGSVTTGNATGVQGSTSSTTTGTSGVVGVATAVTGTTYGGYFSNSSSSGTGILATTSTGASVAVEGLTSSTTNNATGVWGFASGASGATFGGYFQNSSTTAAAAAMAAYANGATGATYAGYFANASATGFGVYSSASLNYFSGNTGIGTSTPAAKLDVSDAIRIGSSQLGCATGTKGSMRYNSSTDVFDFCNGTTWAAINSGATVTPAGSDTQIQYNSNGVLSASSGFVYSSAGTVGIGRNPSYKLDIFGNSVTSGIHLTGGTNADSGLYINSPGTTEAAFSAGANYSSYSNPNYVMTAKTSTAAGMYFMGGTARIFTNSGLTAGNTFTTSTRLYIGLTGDVGIGTMSPVAKLDVSGDVRFYSTANTLTCNSLAKGGLRYNSVTDVFDFCNGSTWAAIATPTAETVSIDNLSDAATNYTSHNLFLGQNAGAVISSGTKNILIGEQAGTNLTTGSQNTFIGWQTGLFMVSGSENTFMGNSAGVNSTGTANVMIGKQAGYTTTSGNQNVYIGRNAALYANGGGNNVLIGDQVGSTLVSGNNNILLGYNVDVPLAGTSNYMSLGNLIFSQGIDGTGTTVSSGNIGIGTKTPAAKLDVSDAIRVGSSQLGCAAGTVGALRYNSSTNAFDYCGGVSPAWTAFGSGTSSLGTSASATSPSRSGDATTGFYSAAGTQVSVANAGVQTMQWNTVASGVNYISVSGGATGTGPTMIATGTDTNIDLNLNTTGAGLVSHNGGIKIGSATIGCVTATKGAIRYNSTNNNFDYCGGSGPAWTSFSSGVTPGGSDQQVQLNSNGVLYASSGLTFNSTSGLMTLTGKISVSDRVALGATQTGMAAPSYASIPLSSVASAAAANTIANANYAQVWNWDTLSTQTALTLGSGSMTTGSVLAVTSSYNNVSATGAVTDLTTTGTSSAAIPLRVNNAGTGLSFRVNDDGTTTDTTPFSIDASGNTGIGTATPAMKLDVADAIKIGSSQFGCITATKGAIRYNSTNNNFDYCGGSTPAWTAFASGVTPGGSDQQVQINNNGVLYASTGLTFSSSTGLLNVTGKVGVSDRVSFGTQTGLAAPAYPTTALSSISSATGGNTLANGANSQVWNWDSLTTTNAMTMASSTVTTGSVLSVSGTTNSGAATGNVLKIQVNGASSALVPLMIVNTGAGLSFRVNDDGTSTDSTPFVVDASGNVGIQKTTPAAALDVVGNIQYTGTITDVSDIRLKTDIVPLDNRGSMLGKLGQVKTYSFVMKDDAKKQVEFGVMAQELEKTFPELVHTADDKMATKSVNYVGLIAPMIKAGQELEAENKQMKAELAALKAQQDEMKTAMNDIQKDMKGMKAHTGYGINKAGMDGWMMLLIGAVIGGNVILFAAGIARRRKA